MWDITFETINGMMFGIEFPTWVALKKDDSLDEDAPNPFVIQLDILIFRFNIVKF
jgi:hypothetical protein